MIFVKQDVVSYEDFEEARKFIEYQKTC